MKRVLPAVSRAREIFLSGTSAILIASCFVLLPSSCDALEQDEYEGFVHVSSVSLNIDGRHVLDLSKTLQLEFTILPEDAEDKSFTWINTDPTVVSLDENGLVTPLKEGVSIVGIRTVDKGIRGVAIISVEIAKATSVEITEPAYAFSDLLDPPHRLQAVVQPDDGQPRGLRWSSSDISCCLVDQEGLVTVTGGGSSVITVETLDGTDLKATCTVTVPGTMVKDRNYDSGDDYYKILYDPIEVEVPVLDDGKVCVGTEKRIWLDRNLGATARASSLWDPDACGSMFQWGRPADGHEKNIWTKNSGGRLLPELVNPVTTVLGASRSEAGHSSYVTVPGFKDPLDGTKTFNDWTRDLNSLGWGGVQIKYSAANEDYVSAEGMYDFHASLGDPSQASNPCPYGYRVPSGEEILQLVMAAADTTDINFTEINSFRRNLFEEMFSRMYLPVTGTRDGKAAQITSNGIDTKPTDGTIFLWSNASYTTNAKAWVCKIYYSGKEGIWNALLSVSNSEKADASPVRCIKD